MSYWAGTYYCQDARSYISRRTDWQLLSPIERDGVRMSDSGQDGTRSGHVGGTARTPSGHERAGQLGVRDGGRTYSLSRIGNAVAACSTPLPRRFEVIKYMQNKSLKSYQL